MSWNGSGVFSRLYNWVNDKTANIKITASRMDAECDGFVAGINNCLAKDGQNSATADIDLGSNKLINVSDPSSDQDAATKKYVDSNEPNRNLIINGNFDLWPEGTSFTNATSSYVYAAGLFRFFGQATTGSATVSRQAFTAGQTDVPGEPAYYLRWNQTVAATGSVALTHPIESVRTGAGQTVTLHFYAKAGASRTIKSRLDQNFGSGGSSTVSSAETDIALTTSWEKHTVSTTLASISGKTIGTSHYLDVVFKDDNSSTFTVDIARVQLEFGSSATDFEARPIAVDVALMERYYEKSYSDGYFAGDIIGAGSLYFTIAGAITNAPIGSVSFKVEKRTAPTVTIYSPVTGASGKGRRTLTSAADRMVAASLIGTTGFTPNYNDASDSDNIYAIHYASDARF